MKLDWRKVFSIDTENFGGWMSENWSSYACIIKCNYSLLDTIAPDFIFVTPERPVECWTTLECRQYLKYFALQSGKTALGARKKAAEFYHDDS
eukprot:2559933-Ditylum_brightwellii.AAC.1